MLLKQLSEREFKIFIKIICGLHVDRTSRINYEKYNKKCYDQ